MSGLVHTAGDPGRLHATRGPTSGIRLAPDTYELVTNVIAQSAQLLNWDTRERLTQVGAADVASAILRDIWGGVMTALSAGDPSTERRNDLVELLALVRAAEHGIHEDRDNHTAPNFCVVSSALKDLQDVQSMTELVARAPAAASMLGFDRVLLSRIECTTWVPESIHISHDPGWAEEILRAGKEHLRTLDNSLIETQMVQQSRPVLVADTTKHPKLHRAMIDVSRAMIRTCGCASGRANLPGG